MNTVMKRKTINIKEEVHTQLLKFSQKHHWPITYIVERLVVRYMRGEFSGSMKDVLCGYDNGGFDADISPDS